MTVAEVGMLKEKDRKRQVNKDIQLLLRTPSLRATAPSSNVTLSQPLRVHTSSMSEVCATVCAAVCLDICTGVFLDFMSLRECQPKLRRLELHRNFWLRTCLYRESMSLLGVQSLSKATRRGRHS